MEDDAKDHRENDDPAENHHNDKQVSLEETGCFGLRSGHGLVQVWLILGVFEIQGECRRIWESHDFGWMRLYSVDGRKELTIILFIDSDVFGLMPMRMSAVVVMMMVMVTVFSVLWRCGRRRRRGEWDKISLGRVDARKDRRGIRRRRQWPLFIERGIEHWPCRGSRRDDC